MTQDGPLHWRRRFQVSAQDLADLRRGWVDVGRQVWESGTRAGRDIKARTELELEALGRAHERQVEQAQRAGDRVKEAVREGLRRGERAVRQFTAVAVPAVTSAARAQTRMARVQESQRVRAADTGARLVTMPPAPFLRQGAVGDPGPDRLYEEFRTGDGPQRRILGPQSAFSREFAVAPSVQEHVQDTLGLWKQRNGRVTCSSTQGGRISA